jgi:hypothetical protein
LDEHLDSLEDHAKYWRAVEKLQRDGTWQRERQTEEKWWEPIEHRVLQGAPVSTDFKLQSLCQGESRVYQVYRIEMSEASLANPRSFWDWVTEREGWFYKNLPMVKDVRWLRYTVGNSSILENWTGFDDMDGYAAYYKQIGLLRQDKKWETQRVSQEYYWHFKDMRLVIEKLLPQIVA